MYIRTGRANWGSIIGVLLVTSVSLFFALAAYMGWLTGEGGAELNQVEKVMFYVQAIVCIFYSQWKLKRNFSKV